MWKTVSKDMEKHCSSCLNQSVKKKSQILLSLQLHFFIHRVLILIQKSYKKKKVTKKETKVFTKMFSGANNSNVTNRIKAKKNEL